MNSDSIDSILDRLSKWSEEHPDKKAWTFIEDNGKVSEEYTYMELRDAATVLANTLLNKHGIKSGDRVLLVFFPGLTFTASILACFMAGIVAVRSLFYTDLWSMRHCSMSLEVANH